MNHRIAKCQAPVTHAPSKGRGHGTKRTYNGLGQMTAEYQATSGSVNTATTPKVQYAYSEMASAANHSRLLTTTYPNGRVLTQTYASGVDTAISRLSSILDGSTTLESYSYLGRGTVVTRAHAQSGVDLTYVKLSGESDGPAGDKYTGLDAFGRIIDQRWTTSAGTAKDRYGYGYDRDGNRLYRENVLSTGNSELYAYDGLNQLTGYQRGTLNGGKTAITGAVARSQSWDFDAVGNFDSQTTNGTAQTRTANKQNEITAISGATTPTYDANGNTTTDEAGKTFTYDAWNRLKTVTSAGGSLLATYSWDGTGRRVKEVRGSTTTELLYSDKWQVLEERVGGSAKFSYAWSPVYVDAMIARDRDTDGNGSLDERLYVTHDANFNMTGLVTTAGAVAERYQHDPYGTVAVLNTSFGAIGGSLYVWNYLHQGARWDADGGLYSLRNREDNPTIGRWMQRDPISYKGNDVNVYRIEANSPQSYLDSTGLLGWDWSGAGVGFILGGPLGGLLGGILISPPAAGARGFASAAIDPAIIALNCILPWNMINGYYDANIMIGVPFPIPVGSGALPGAAGLSMGLQYDTSTGLLHPYFGPAVWIGTPVAGSLTYGPGQTVTPGNYYGGSGISLVPGLVWNAGDSYDGPNFFHEIGLGIGSVTSVQPWFYVMPGR